MLGKHELNCRTNQVKEAINESRDIKRLKLNYHLLKFTVSRRHGVKYVCNSRQVNSFPFVDLSRTIPSSVTVVLDLLYNKLSDISF